MSDEMRVYKSSGNVFKDMGYPNPDRELLRAQLELEIFRILKRNHWNEIEAASRLGITEKDVATFLNGDPSDYEIGALFDFINRLDHHVDVYISPSRAGNAHQQLHAAD
ncbi:XRE family transcriptional regulator [Candidatus Poribacteria bacterium]|nr:XRE family transcriptional regulator [Candidatus Poribacteria bacterium]MBI3336869.1 XRE family transcriptional regulator [Candidatus Peregrinibacteria bacterium]